MYMYNIQKHSNKQTNKHTHKHTHTYTPALGDAKSNPRRCIADGEACESKVSVFSKRCRSVRPWWCARSLQRKNLHQLDGNFAPIRGEICKNLS